MTEPLTPEQIEELRRYAAQPGHPVAKACLATIDALTAERDEATSAYIKYKGVIDRQGARIAAMQAVVEAAPKLLTIAKLLRANAVQCLADHHGHDVMTGCPGWLFDASMGIESAADAVRALTPTESGRADDGWFPISTAKLNFDVVLLYQPAGPGTAECVGQGHRTSLDGHAHDKWVFQGTGWIAEPTLWRPMPWPSIADREGTDSGRCIKQEADDV